MSRNYSIFNAGFSATIPSLYFNKLTLLKELVPDNSQFEYSVNAAHKLLAADYEMHEQHIKRAVEMATYFNFEIVQLPDSPETFIRWYESYITKFEERFPTNRIEYYYYLFSRKLAELVSNIGLSKTCLELLMERQQSKELPFKIKMRFKDCEFILFKLVASAALLSGEPGHAYFNTFYKEIKLSFNDFITIPDELNIEDIQRLAENSDKYKSLIMNGFDKCNELLKYLQV